jgi:hypothetical protein
MNIKMKKVLICIILIIVLLVLLLQIWEIYNIHQQQVAVLAYHNIVLTSEEESKDPDALATTEFEEQLKYLKDNGYVTISVDDYYNWKENKEEIPEKSVIITFDDGYYSFKSIAQPILEKYDCKAICFVIGNATGKITGENGTIGLDEIENHTDNIKYGSHTFALHKQDNTGNPIVKSQKYNEIKQDIEQFDTEEFEAKYLAYPYYTYTKDFVKALKEEDYKLAFAGEEEMATKNVNNYKVPRISAIKSMDEFKEIFETNKYRNKYGNGLVRKICVNIEKML